MYISHLQLQDFRNYTYKELDFIPFVNIILGQNAIGKTTVLEAIHMLSGSQSFRGATRGELIRRDGDLSRGTSIACNVVDSGDTDKLRLDIEPARSRSFVNGNSKADGPRLYDKLKTIVFSSDTLAIVQAGPSVRRGFLDSGIKQLKPGYGKLLTQYQKLLDAKNSVLKNWDTAPTFRDLLDDYTQRMALISAQIIKYRHNFVQGLLPVALATQGEISKGNEVLGIGYKTISSVTDTSASLEQVWRQVLDHGTGHRSAEIASRTCLSGIHKDDLALLINGQSARAYASQGQARSVALSLKIAEHSLFCKEIRQPPVLLLDDVFSELDRMRREYIMDKIKGSQVIITSCYEEDYFPSDAQVIKL